MFEVQKTRFGAYPITYSWRLTSRHSSAIVASLISPPLSEGAKSLLARPWARMNRTVIRIEMRGGIQQPTGQIVEPIRQGQQPVLRPREGRGDSHEAAELVDVLGLGIHLGKLDAEFVGCGAGMSEPFAAHEGADGHGATDGREHGELEQFLRGLDASRQLTWSNRSPDHIQEDAGVEEENRESCPLDVIDDVGDARHTRRVLQHGDLAPIYATWAILAGDVA